MKNFDPNVPVFANKTITVNGETFEPGDALDWFGLGLPERRVRQLFEQRKITHLPQFIQAGIKTKSTIEVREPKKKNDDIAGDFRVVEKSRFWFDVVSRDGEKMNDKSLRKDAAIEFADELTLKKRQALEEALKESNGE
jgi:hypothetical protein